MKIGIDARFYGPKVGGGGLGRYVEQLVTQLQQIDTENRYLLFLKPENFDDCVITNPNFEKVKVDIHWYSLKEQLELGKIIDKEQLDLIHFPHWNIPFNVKTPFVVTVHDLILLEQPNSAHITTRHPLIFWMKRLGHRFVLRRALKKAKHVFAVSEYTKLSILNHFTFLNKKDITVAYNGLTNLEETQQLPSTPASKENTLKINDPYFLYVGNAYPHKNLISLLHAFSFFHQTHPSVRLVLAGRQDAFYERLKNEIEELDIPKDIVHFVMNPSDGELKTLYQNATLYLFPSLIEGFGLPPLEAMQEGTPVAAAESSCLPEILGDAARYFAPYDIEEMVEVMEDLFENEDKRKALIEKGFERIKLYSWKEMTKTIHAIYGKQ
jgi:glycosyltransferase involved in cell wall biosynthesis